MTPVQSIFIIYCGNKNFLKNQSEIGFSLKYGWSLKGFGGACSGSVSITEIS